MNSSSGSALRSDPAATEARIGALRAYMGREVLGPSGFCCTSYGACLASTAGRGRFFEGQLSHVGHHFDLPVDAKPLRIVVVGQEYGYHHKLSPDEQRHIGLDRRWEMVHDGSGLSRRYYADATHRARNPHMRGTTSALRVLFGKGLGADRASEFCETPDGERFHLFDGFALVNALLCSAGPDASSNGRSTRLMRRNCLRHFSATLEILEPTIVVIQGVGVRRWIDAAIDDPQQLAPHLEEALVRGRRTLVCSFSHPAARGDQRWGDRLDAPYLLEVVEPTLRLALDSL